MSRFRRGFAIASLLLAAIAGSAEGAPTDLAQEDTATEVVVIVVDGLNPAEVTPLDAPRLSELKDAGTWYEEARSVFVAETIPNHVAMMTGSYGDRSGIPVNKFWSRRAADEPGTDMEDPRLLKADTMFTASNEQCPETRTAAVLSKTYLHGIFSTDSDGDGAVDADYLWEPSPVIPGSDHAPDAATADAAVAEIANDPDLLFVNLGDVDRSGHVDPSGFQDPLARTAVLKDSDQQVGRIVDEIKASGDWEHTVLMLVSDHSMDWSTPEAFISLDEVFAGDERVAGKYEVVQNGGVDNVYLKPDIKQQKRVRAALMDLASSTEGVAGVWYRRPNKRDPMGPTLPKSWHLNTRRAGDVIAMAEPGRRFSDPSSSSNPIPGNHGHAITRHSVALVTGGAPEIKAAVISASQPDAIDPLTDTEILTEQSEQVDIGVTVGWLMGIDDPGTADGKRAQYQGRVLREAFTARPAIRSCG